MKPTAIVEGVISQIGASEVKTARFTKRDLIVTTEGEYPDPYKIEVTNDNCLTLDSFQVGQRVQVTVNITGRSWQKPGTTEPPKFFTDLRFQSIVALSQPVTAAPAAAAPVAAAPVAAAAAPFTPFEG
tara:strand:+ start:1916 stop:2299 length:384 start_codon:yes stop_codon:yes gene_type:complete